MTKIISLFAGPGAGKSTCAAYLYSKLKADGHSAELVREYIKDWAWEKRIPSVYDQFYILGKQIRKESFLLDKVDFIVTDSPVWICGYYSEALAPPMIKHGVESCIRGYYLQAKADGHSHYNVWLNRASEYNPEGRFQTAAEAEKVDLEMKSFLKGRGIEFDEVTADFDSLDDWLANI